MPEPGLLDLLPGRGLQLGEDGNSKGAADPFTLNNTPRREIRTAPCSGRNGAVVPTCHPGASGIQVPSPWNTGAHVSFKGML